MPDQERIPRETEVAIVGAGPAGSLIAARLAGAGKNVVVLEAGPAWSVDDLVSSQIWARRLKWGGPTTLRDGRDPFGTGFTGGWGFGGAALHHYAGWPRMSPDDFRLRMAFGKGADWPVGYDELRPWYDRVQAEIGIAGEVTTDPHPPSGALPPLPAFTQARRLAVGFEKLGRAVRPMRAAIATVPFRGRPGCLWDGWCDAGCPTGALANPLVTWLPQARAAGASFFARTSAIRILGDRKDRAAGLEYVQAGSRGAIHADVVILAGGAIQNARLLLASRSIVHPAGFANANGLVGRYFTHHIVANLFAMFDDDLQNHLGVSLPPLEGDPVSPRNRDNGPFGDYRWGLGPALKTNDLLGIAMSRPGLFGAELDRFIHRAARHLANLSAIAETLPEAGNRIEIGPGRDELGMPLARIVNTHSANTRSLWALAVADGERLLDAAGARERWHLPMVGAHQLGGTRMGHDPATSVTDGYGRLHDIANAFVAGGGLFPTCGATGPTFTIQALAWRTAEHVMARWAGISH